MQVVIDRLGNADHGKLKIVEEADGHPQRVIAADDDQGIERKGGEVLPQGDQVGFRVLVGIGPRRPQDRSSLADEAVGFCYRERHGEVPHQAAPALKDADAGPPALRIRRTTARMTAFKPGQSPPPVSRPTFIDQVRWGERGPGRFAMAGISPRAFSTGKSNRNRLA